MNNYFYFQSHSTPPPTCDTALVSDWHTQHNLHPTLSVVIPQYPWVMPYFPKRYYPGQLTRAPRNFLPSETSEKRTGPNLRWTYDDQIKMTFRWKHRCWGQYANFLVETQNTNFKMISLWYVNGSRSRYFNWDFRLIFWYAHSHICQRRKSTV